MHIGETEIAALKTIGEPLMIDAEQVKRGGLEVMYMQRIFRSVVAEIIGAPNVMPGFTPPPAIHMSASHFSRVFKAALGTSPIGWLRRERISQAKRRLAETGDDIKQIAEQVGYGDRFYFSKDFKQLAGLTPREFRRRETLDRSA